MNHQQEEHTDEKIINVLDYAEPILKSVRKGVLLTTVADGRVNTMAISWGMLGIEWGRLLFSTFVRTGRFTRELLDKNGEFTVNIPMRGSDPALVGKCGTCSGREVDKFEQFGLTAEPGEKVAVPGIRASIRSRWSAASSAGRNRTGRRCMPRSSGNATLKTSEARTGAQTMTSTSHTSGRSSMPVSSEMMVFWTKMMNLTTMTSLIMIKCGRFLDEDDFDRIDDEDE